MQDRKLHPRAKTSIGVWLLLGTAILSLLAWNQSQLEEARSDAENCGWMFTSESWLPRWVTQWTGKDVLQRPVYVTLREGRDPSFTALSRFRTLRYLDVCDSSVADDDLSELRIQGLRELVIADTAITDHGLHALAQTNLDSLERITLNGTLVTDAGILHLSGLPSLESVSLNHTAVTDKGAAALRNISALRSIELAQTAISDDGVEMLSQIPSLTFICLFDTAVTDRSVSCLAGLPGVRYIDLRNTDVSDACVPALARMTSLQLIRLRGSAVTSAGVKELRTSLPDAQVYGN